MFGIDVVEDSVAALFDGLQGLCVLALSMQYVGSFNGMLSFFALDKFQGLIKVFGLDQCN